MLVGGCAYLANPTGEKHEKILNSWVGSSETKLISEWGPPNSVYQTDGVKYITYNVSASGYVPGIAPLYETTYSGKKSTTTAIGGYSGYTYTVSCNSTFTIINKVITSWRWEGSGCLRN